MNCLFQRTLSLRYISPHFERINGTSSQEFFSSCTQLITEEPASSGFRITIDIVILLKLCGFCPCFHSKYIVSEIYPLADKFDLSPRLKQNGERKNRIKTQMVLFGYDMKEFIHSKVAYIFPCAGVTIFKKKPRCLVK